VSNLEEIWIPLVDEPIGSIVAEIQQENADIDALVSTPHRCSRSGRSRTSASDRARQLLFDNDVPPYDGSETWVDALLRDPAHHDALTREVRAVAEEIAADPKYADDERLGPDDEARDRFREFARKTLETG
jgi:hypothetical protein